MNFEAVQHSYRLEKDMGRKEERDKEGKGG